MTIHGSADKLAAYESSCCVELKLYSDGSGLDGSVGAAAVIYKTGRSPKVLKLHSGTLEDYPTYEAEAVGLSLALHLLSQERDAHTAMIMLDNQAVIAAVL